MKVMIWILLLLNPVTAFCQQPVPSSVQSSGACSPNIIANTGKVEFTCNAAIDQETAKKIISVLNQVLHSQSGSLTSVNEKLDQILALLQNQAPRRLTEAQKSVLASCLSQKPGTFSIGALQDNSEAHRYAEDWRAVFLAAGWKSENTDIPIQIFQISGGMWSGVHVSVHGVKDGGPLLEGSPEKNLFDCLIKANDAGAGIGAAVIPYKDTPTGTVRVDVSDLPPAQ
jgi:hypothetical protein